MPSDRSPQPPSDQASLRLAWAVLAALSAAGVVVAPPLALTAASVVYRGPQDVLVLKQTAPAVNAVVVVESCRRSGVVSRDGLGWWWRCTGTAQPLGGTERPATSDRSVLTPADVGTTLVRPVACADLQDGPCRVGEVDARSGVPFWAAQVLLASGVGIAVGAGIGARQAWSRSRTA